MDNGGSGSFTGLRPGRARCPRSQKCTTCLVGLRQSLARFADEAPDGGRLAVVDTRICVWKAPHLFGVDEDLPMAEYDQELDACGLNCPLPILRAKKALTKMATGEVLRIIATDPGSVKDFEAFSRQTGNELLESNEDGGRFYYRLRKA